MKEVISQVITISIEYEEFCPFAQASILLDHEDPISCRKGKQVQDILEHDTALEQRFCFCVVHEQQCFIVQNKRTAITCGLSTADIPDNTPGACLERCCKGMVIQIENT